MRGPRLGTAAAGPWNRGSLDGFLIAAAALAVYLLTLSRAVGTHDFGELVTTAATLGIAHPTGYPLLTLIGRVAAMLPVPGAEALLKLNVLSALFCAGAVFFFHRLVAMLLRGWLAPDGGGASPSARFSAAAAALCLAFSRLFWTQAVSFEVYAFHLFLTTVVLVLFLESLRPGASPRLWLLFAYVLGLSFSNHMMMVLLAPACLYAHFSTLGFGAAAWRRIVAAVPPFLAGLTPYLYLPIRSAADPLMNWTRPVTLEAFWRHVTAKQYQHRMLESAEGGWGKVADFFATLPGAFAYLPLLLALFGLVHLARHERRTAAFSLLLFLACVLFVGFYEMIDPNFELNAHIAVAIWVAFGAAVLRGPFRGRFAFLLLAACLLPLAMNYRKVDASRDYIVEDYARNVLESAEKDAVILTGQSATFTFPAYYLQIIRGIRPDVAVVDTAVLAVRWHMADLGKLHPALFAESRREFEDLLREGDKLLRGEAFDAALLLARRDEVIRNLVLRSGRPAYITYDMPNMQGFRKIPSGLLYRLSDREAPPPRVSFREFGFRPLPAANPFSDMIRDDYAAAYVNQGIQAAVVYGDSALGLRLVRKAMTVYPEFAPARDWAARLAR